MKELFKRIIKLYQVIFSSRKGIFWGLSPEFFGCRFSPSCSDYALEAIEKYGVSRGCFLGLKRILRCHSFNEGGHDPVPYPALNAGKVTLSVTPKTTKDKDYEGNF